MHKDITCFGAAICRDLVEGGDGKRYFWDLTGWPTHAARAQAAGLLEALEPPTLTPLGRAIGEACRSLPDGPSWRRPKEYSARARKVAATMGRPNQGKCVS